MLGAESFTYTSDTRAQEQALLIAKHLIRVQRLPRFEAATCVMGIENNLGESVWNVQKNLEELRSIYANIPKVHYIRKTARSDSQLGVLMTAPLKANMARIMQHRIAAKRLCFHERFFSLTAPSAYAMRAKLVTQMTNYERKIKRSATDPDAQPRIRYSGKSHGLDDLAMCLQINAIVYCRFVEHNAG